MKKYQYQLIKVDNDMYRTIEYANDRMKELAPFGWELADWKSKSRYTFLLFRKEVTDESNTGR